MANVKSKEDAEVALRAKNVLPPTIRDMDDGTIVMIRAILAINTNVGGGR